MWPSCSDVKMSKCDVCADLLFCFVNLMMLFWCRSCCCHCCCYSSPFWSEGAHAVSWHMEKSKMDSYYYSETIVKLIMKMFLFVLCTIVSAMKLSSWNDDMEVYEYFHLLFENSMRLIKLLWFQLESLLYLDYIFVLFFLFHLNGVRNDCV